MLQACWQALPPLTRDLLLLGSVGAEHLTEAAGQALTEGEPRLAAALALAAWEQNPLDGKYAAQAMAQLARPEARDLPAPRTLLHHIRKAWQALPANSPYAVAAQTGDYDAAWDEAVQALADPQRNGNLYWSDQLVTLGQMLGRSTEALPLVLELPVLRQELLAPLRHYLQGKLFFLAAQWPQAREAFARATERPDCGGWLLPLKRGGEAALAAGDPEQALELWREVLRQRPWHTQLLLRAHAVLSPLDSPLQTPPTAALLYTFNKAPFLDATLDALAASRGLTRIFALDNGSSDATSEVLGAWEQRLGRESLRVIRLPVNVGAPAARNWLAALPELDSLECVAYLDDDALPPPDWLEQLHAARLAYPEAAAWGCCVVDHDAPDVIQSADLHLRLSAPPGAAPATDLRQALAMPFAMSQLHAQVPMRGQFRYLRPCVSVTGCCHLFDTARLREGGGFDLRFSPTQCDDLERDLRQAIKEGRFCCYQGGLEVRHRQKSGHRVRLSGPAQGNYLGNRYKLMHRYPPETLLELQQRQQALLLDDLTRRLPCLEQGLGL